MPEERETCPHCKVRVAKFERHMELRHKQFTLIRFLLEAKSTILTGILLLSSFLLILLSVHPTTIWKIHLHKILMALSIAVGGIPLAKVAFEELIKESEFDVDFLVVMAAVGAITIDYWIEAGVLIFLFSLSETLSNYSVFRNRKTLKNLLDLSPSKARVRKNDEIRRIQPKEVEVGDLVMVKPGERIPVDGVIKKGASAVNEAPITGESMPVQKEREDEVYAGTLNLNGSLEIQTLKKSGDTTLSRIVQLVEEARMSKAETEKFVSRFVRYYTPSILAFSALIFLIPTVILSQPYTFWLYRSLVLLVLSCPCAFVISTPVSMFSAVTKTAKKGILIKGGAYIERFKDVNTIIFDKTRTLTTGNPKVTDVIPLRNNTTREILTIAGSLENHSTHPLAKPIIKEYNTNNEGTLKEVEEFKSLTGMGIEGIIGGELYKIGKPALFSLQQHVIDQIKALSSEGKTVVVLGKEDEPIGIIGLMDAIRPEAKEVITTLKKRGKKVVMLTGDNELTAQAVARQLGIEDYRANLLPEEKVDVVDVLRKNEVVAMVGDGVNDAPALAKSHVGIAMGAAGSDTAIESADIALLHDDLSQLIFLLDFSQQTMKVIKENIYTSIGVKSILAGLAFFGWVTLWMAVGIGDVGISLLVTINAILLGKT